MNVILCAPSYCLGDTSTVATTLNQFSAIHKQIKL